MPRIRFTHRPAFAAAACATLLLAACGDDNDESTRIVIDDTEIAGSSRADLMRDYIATNLAVPADESIFAGPEGCDGGRSTDDVYFAPTWVEPGDASVSCTMRASQALYLSPVAAFCFEDDVDQADQACVDAQFNVTSAEVVIDGEPVEDLESSLVQYDPQELELGTDNILEMEPGPIRSIGKGYVVVVENLQPGDHEIVLKGDFGNGEFAGSLTIALTVE